MSTFNLDCCCEDLLVLLLEEVADGEYTWVEWRQKADGTFELHPTGKSSAVDNGNAYEINGQTGLADRLAFIKRGYTSGATGGQKWLIEQTVGGGTGGTFNTVRNGSGVPSAGLGINGDFYINISSWTIYGPKSGGAWGSATSLVGPAGPTGPTGPAGADGKTILAGSGVPSNALGTDGDYYIDTSLWKIYGPKSGGTWPAGVSIVGSTGATGPTGATGAAGAAGVDGGLKYTFSTTTTAADPGNGFARFNNASPGLSSHIYLSYTDGDTFPLTDFIDSWDDSSTVGHRGILIFRNITSPTKFAIFAITGAITNHTTWADLQVSAVSSSAAFLNADTVRVSFYRTGNLGSTGATGATGSAGAAGADGKTILNGSGAPGSGIGVNGDFYIDILTWNFYGPKTGGAWGSPIPLKSPADINYYRHALEADEHWTMLNDLMTCVDFSGLSGTGMTVVPDTLYAIPFTNPKARTIAEIGFLLFQRDVEPSSHFRVGVYSVVGDSNLRAGTKLFEFTELALGAAEVGYKYITDSHTLPAGKLCMVFNSEDGLAIGGLNPANLYDTFGFKVTGGTPGNPILMWTKAAAYGALPSTFPTDALPIEVGMAENVPAFWGRLIG